jgi:hypothetical protein
MKIVAFMLVLLAAVIARAEESALTFHPAHWVDGDEIEPTFYISSFGVLAFPSPTEGWMAGERYVLHIKGDRLEVAFVDLGRSITSVGFANPDVGWAGSQDEESGAILNYRLGTWRRERPTGIGWPYWGVHRIMAGHTGDAWATTWVRQEPPGPPPWPQARRGLLRYDGSLWAVDEHLPDHFGTMLADACQAPDGSWWFVGSDTSAESGMAMMLARWDGRRLQTMAGPASETERSTLYLVRCLSDGSAWALGSVRRAVDQPAEILVLRFTTTWERMPVPSFFAREPIPTAIAPVNAREAWVSASCGNSEAECCERFLHYRDGNWETVSLPLMPGGRCTAVSIRDMQFVSPDEGWAVANDDTPRLGVGRIFHYKDGTWRNRNWNWHFWDAPWFNLFG